MESTKRMMGRVFRIPPKKIALVSPQVLPMPAGKPPHVDWATVIDTHNFSWSNNPDNNHRKQGIFHPSNGLHPENNNCLREIVLDLVHAQRSWRRSMPSKVIRAMDQGTDRHAGLHGYFQKMAEARHFGIVKYEQDLKAVHPTLPLEGEADGRVTTQQGWRYVLDFKTISKKNAEKTFEPSFQYFLQVNTYLGLLGEKAGYLVYEVKDGQTFLGPMERFRVDFDPAIYAQTEQYCRDLLEWVNAEQIPEFDAEVCKASIMFCWYVDVCEAHQRGELTFQDIDQRDEATRRRHLPVIQ